MQTHRVAIFASGSGTNAENLVTTFRQKKHPVDFIVLANRADAPVLQRAQRLSVPAFTFGKTEMYQSDALLRLLEEQKIDFIVLAGFLWKVPPSLIAAYPNTIINIHPALLPKFGGRGMYGERVHSAVLEANENVSGITIHHVTEEYDQGATIFQAECPVREDDTPESLARRIHQLEYQHYPRVLAQLLKLSE